MRNSLLKTANFHKLFGETDVWHQRPLLLRTTGMTKWGRHISLVPGVCFFCGISQKSPFLALLASSVNNIILTSFLAQSKKERLYEQRRRTNGASRRRKTKLVGKDTSLVVLEGIYSPINTIGVGNCLVSWSVFHILSCFNRYGSHNKKINGVSRDCVSDPRCCTVHYSLGRSHLLLRFSEENTKINERNVGLNNENEIGKLFA